MGEITRTFNCGNALLEYMITGEAHEETLFFVHGAGASLEQYKDQHAYFSSKYKVISVSLRGHGNSTLPVLINKETFSLEKLRDDLIALMSHLNLNDIHYIGNSAGGILGYLLVEKQPGRFKSLVTFGTTAEMTLPKILTQLVAGIDKVMLRYRREGYLRFTVRHTSKVSTVQEKVYEMFSKAIDAIPHFRSHLGNYNFLETVSNMTCPYMLIESAHDTDINRVLKSTKAAMQKNKHAEIVTLNDAGHIANLDQPETFNQILTGFFERINTA